MSVENGISNSTVQRSSRRTAAERHAPSHCRSTRAAVVGDAPVFLGRERIGAKDVRRPSVTERVEQHGDRVVLDRAERVGLAGRDRVALRDGGREAIDLGIERFERDIQRRSRSGRRGRRCETATARHRPARSARSSGPRRWRRSIRHRRYRRRSSARPQAFPRRAARPHERQQASGTRQRPRARLTPRRCGLSLGAPQARLNACRLQPL